MRPAFAWKPLFDEGSPHRDADVIAVEGRDCQITLERRPHYCDRGNFLAKLHPTGPLAREIDGQDGWPRYYFDRDRAKAEIEDWLIKRRQVVDVSAPAPFLYRDHRGGLAESLETVRAFADRDALAAEILPAINAMRPGKTLTVNDLVFERYARDERIGWHETWIVRVDDFVAGFTNREPKPRVTPLDPYSNQLRTP